MAYKKNNLHMLLCCFYYCKYLLLWKLTILVLVLGKELWVDASWYFLQITN